MHEFPFKFRINTKLVLKGINIYIYGKVELLFLDIVKYIIFIKIMSNIYDISETPEKLKLKDQLLTKLNNNNKHSDRFNKLIDNHNDLRRKYNIKLEEFKQRQEKNTIVLLKDNNDDKEEKVITILKNLFNSSYSKEEGIYKKIQIIIKAIQITEKENRKLFPENEILKQQCLALESRKYELNTISQNYAKEIFKLKQENKQITKENCELKDRLG